MMVVDLILDLINKLCRLSLALYLILLDLPIEVIITFIAVIWVLVFRSLIDSESAILGFFSLTGSLMS